jgi:competence protein ComEC
MLSVGQGESILINLPNGRIILLDGGGFLHETGKDFGERVLAPALMKMGIKRIDVMVMSHSHPDHAGGLPFVAENFAIGEFWEPVSGGSGTRYELLKGLLAGKGVPVRSLKAGEKIEPSPGVVLTVLSPSLKPALFFNEDPEENEESLVLHIRYGTAGVLLTADAGFPAEERIIHSTTDISAGLLKVGHHGSRYSTSEALLDRVAPDFALISAGRDNSFGLPSDRTIKVLKNRRIKIYRTDVDGTVVMSTDGSKWSCTSKYFE